MSTTSTLPRCTAPATSRPDLRPLAPWRLKLLNDTLERRPHVDPTILLASLGGQVSPFGCLNFAGQSIALGLARFTDGDAILWTPAAPLVSRETAGDQRTMLL